MPTNDERREAAARLRDYSTRNFDESSPWLYMSKALTGSFTAYDDASDLFTDLADLIEPEPERTCLVENLGGINGSIPILLCKSCGGLNFSKADGSTWNYCPNCGARVVE